MSPTAVKRSRWRLPPASLWSPNSRMSACSRPFFLRQSSTSLLRTLSMKVSSPSRTTTPLVLKVNPVASLLSNRSSTFSPNMGWQGSEMSHSLDSVSSMSPSPRIAAWTLACRLYAVKVARPITSWAYTSPAMSSGNKARRSNTRWGRPAKSCRTTSWSGVKASHVPPVMRWSKILWCQKKPSPSKG